MWCTTIDLATFRLECRWHFGYFSLYAHTNLSSRECEGYCQASGATGTLFHSTWQRRNISEMMSEGSDGLLHQYLEVVPSLAYALRFEDGAE